MSDVQNNGESKQMAELGMQRSLTEHLRKPLSQSVSLSCGNPNPHFRSRGAQGLRCIGTTHMRRVSQTWSQSLPRRTICSDESNLLRTAKLWSLSICMVAVTEQKRS